MPTVVMPDGTQVNFPDDMPQEQIKGMIASKFPDVAKSSQEKAQTGFSAITGPISDFITNERQKGADLNNAINRQDQGQQNPASTALQIGLNNIVGGLAQVPVAGLKMAGNALYQELIPESAKNTLDTAGQAIAEGPIGQEVGKLAKQYQQNDQTYAQMHPEAAANFQAGREGINLLPLIPEARAAVGGAAEATGEALKDVGSSLGKNIESGISKATEYAATQKQLPADLKSLDTLVGVGKSTLFAKEPNAIEAGLKANTAISANYDQAKNIVSQAYKSVSDEGNFEMPAPVLYKKLDNITQYLEDKVAPGSKEQAALSRLREIKNNLQDRYSIPAKLQQESTILDNSGSPIIKSNATPAMQAIMITPNDLVEIEKSINSGLSKNAFMKSGDVLLMDFKNSVQGLLRRAGELNPSFGEKYTTAKSLASDLARTYTDNKSLKTFWKPEDYIAWKAAKNNPKLSPYTDETRSRANLTLERLNTKNLGRYNAMIKALPEDQAKTLMRAAYIKAQKEKTSVTNAAINLLKLHPSNAAGMLKNSILGQGKKSNIGVTIKDLKKLKK